VRITHGNLLSNITDMAAGAQLDPESDIMVSWLPMFHDMGMVGFYTTPMTMGIELVKVTPVDFLTGPLLWAELISKYHATITAAPNFAYALLGRRLSGVDADDTYDLSSMRLALNGAEPIDEKAVRSFTDNGARFGLRPECVFPAYGMVTLLPRGGGKTSMRSMSRERVEISWRTTPSIPSRPCFQCR